MIGFHSIFKVQRQMTLPILGNCMSIRLILLGGCSCVLLFQNSAWGQSNSVLSGWIESHSKVKTWSAPFTQTRILKTLTQPLTTQGHLWFVAPNQFRWELGQPVQTIALRRQDELFVIYPLLKRAEHLSITNASNGQWRDALTLFEAGFPRSQAELRRQFNVISVVNTNVSWEVLLQPSNRSSRHLIKGMKVVLSTNDFTLNATELTLGDGSSIRTEFGRPVVDAAVPEKLFKPQLEKEFKITEISSQ